MESRDEWEDEAWVKDNVEGKGPSLSQAARAPRQLVVATWG